LRAVVQGGFWRSSVSAGAAEARAPGRRSRHRDSSDPRNRRVAADRRDAASALFIWPEGKPTVQKLIEDDKISTLGKAIEDSSSFYKMQSFNQALFQHIKEKTITADEALAFSRNPNDLRILLKTQGLMPIVSQ
jgi:hypothetical protein